MFYHHLIRKRNIITNKVPLTRPESRSLHIYSPVTFKPFRGQTNGILLNRSFERHYRLGTVNSNTFNSKLSLYSKFSKVLYATILSFHVYYLLLI